MFSGVVSFGFDFVRVLAMEDVSVELCVKLPCGGPGGCSQKIMTKTILMWSGMVPMIGDRIDTENGPHRIRLHVVGRHWWNRSLTLICRPVKSFSMQTLADAGFAE